MLPMDPAVQIDSQQIAVCMQQLAGAVAAAHKNYDGSLH